jgi:hypothetical protein
MIHAWIYLSNRSHAHDSQRQARRVPTWNKSVLPSAGSQALLCLGGVSENCQDEKNRHVGGGFGHCVSSIAEPDVVLGHPVDIKLVVASGGRGNDFAVWQKSAKKLFIKWFIRDSPLYRIKIRYTKVGRLDELVRNGWELPCG